MREYQDYRYVMQDAGTLFIGAKFNFGDIAAEEEVPFKFRSIVMRHFLQTVDKEDTFESVFYYMKPEGYMYEVLLQLRTKVKVSELTPVKTFFGKTKWVYKEHIYKMKEFAEMPQQEKERKGIVIQETQYSKLALMTFAV